jgi:hypothetical protein
VGLDVELADGDIDGRLMGPSDELSDGRIEGDRLGDLDGFIEGGRVGTFVEVGLHVGAEVGELDGD